MAELWIGLLRIKADALVRLAKAKSSTNDEFFGPSDFDLLMAVPPPPLLASGPSCSSRVQIEHQAMALPRFRTAQRAHRPVEAALHFAAELGCPSLRRAVQIPLVSAADQPRPSCSSSSSSALPAFHSADSSQLLLVPATLSQAGHQRMGSAAALLEFCPLTNVLLAAMNFDSALVDTQSQNLVVRLSEWLTQGQCRLGVDFLHSLFLLPPASARILHCVHNPAYGPRVNYFCHRRLQDWDKENGGQFCQRSMEMEQEKTAKLSNAIHAEMLQKEKYELFVINPLFGTDISSLRRCLMAPDYFVKGRSQSGRSPTKRRRKSMGASEQQQQRSPTEFWEQQFPLHKHALTGNAKKIRELLAQGYDPNEPDNDLWTALHYCAFYNRLEACQALMLHPRTDVNVPNRTGATPLHFAALNGHVYVAELILSHQLADISIRDLAGKTPLDICAPVPKPDWQGVAFLLQQCSLRPAKVEVQLVGANSLQVEVEDPDTALAGELRAKVLAMEGLDPELGGKIFAIWLVDSTLSLQLKAEQKVKVHLDKWAEHLEKFGGERWEDEEGLAEGEQEDEARVVLKRDARTLLGDEQMLARKSAVAVSLLYGEAEQQFLHGLLPCHERHFLPLAALVMRRLHGPDWPSSVDISLLRRVLPRHLIPAPADVRQFGSLVAKLRQAYRQLGTLSLVQLQLHFLRLCWSLNVYGCTFFRAILLMAKPLRGNLRVLVGLNDWGMSVLNANTRRQVAAIELAKLDVKFTPNTQFLEVQAKRQDFAGTITTPQAMLINNLLKQLRLKVQEARQGAGSSQ